MKNNLLWLIPKAGLTKLQFGMSIYPKMPTDTDNQEKMIVQKVTRLCRADLKTIHTVLLQPIADTLKCDFNTLYGYNE